MSGYRGLQSGENRPATWAERARLEDLRARGVEDVYVEPAVAPGEFWQSVVVATHWHLAGDSATEVWSAWATEVRYATGWREFGRADARSYEQIVGEGMRTADSSSNLLHVPVPDRLAAVEHLLDVTGTRWGETGDDFRAAVNERARHFRVGVQLEGRRFIPVTSEHLHQELVQPTLLLLRLPKFADADSLYRKAFERALSGDPAGAVTAATSAVEELLRAGLNLRGLTLEQLLSKAREVGWMIPATSQVIVKLAALREASDAHEAGTDSFEVAMLAIHLSGAIIRFLGDTLP